MRLWESGAIMRGVSASGSRYCYTCSPGSDWHLFISIEVRVVEVVHVPICYVQCADRWMFSHTAAQTIHWVPWNNYKRLRVKVIRGDTWCTCYVIRKKCYVVMAGFGSVGRMLTTGVFYVIRRKRYVIMTGFGSVGNIWLHIIVFDNCLQN